MVGDFINRLNGKYLAIVAFIISFTLLLRQNYLFDTDPYLHLATAKYISANGFPTWVPFIEIAGNEGFNYLSEKWLFIQIISVFYKSSINDIILSKIYISLVFASLVFTVSRILGEVHARPGWAIIIFAFPFQLLLKLRPEPLGILFTLLLLLILLMDIHPKVKIFSLSIVLLIHSQTHAFFVIDILLIGLYSFLYKRPSILLSIAPLPLGIFINPYREVWLSSLYFDTIPRLRFSSPLSPVELTGSGLIEIGFFLLLYGYAYFKMGPKKTIAEKFIFIATGFLLISMPVLVRTLSYVFIFIVLVVAIALSKSRDRFLQTIMFSLLIVNILTTFFYPTFLMPGYYESSQLEVLQEINSKDIVLGQWDLTPYVAYYTGASSVTGGDIYYLWMRSPSLYRDYEDLFLGRRNRANSFNHSIIYFDRSRFKGLYQLLDQDEDHALIAENKRYAVFRVRE